MINNAGQIFMCDKKISTYTWKDPGSGESFHFYLYKGNVNIDRPNEAVINKAKQIAQKLHAKVQGDELEIY